MPRYIAIMKMHQTFVKMNIIVEYSLCAYKNKINKHDNKYTIVTKYTNKVATQITT